MVGERRIVTMLFCDVKGSTAAAQHLDPEEWTEIINGAFEFMIKPVYKYEGMVARLMGDAMLAFFGAPIAHEDDPLRALPAPDPAAERHCRRRRRRPILGQNPGPDRPTARRGTGPLHAGLRGPLRLT